MDQSLSVYEVSIGHYSPTTIIARSAGVAKYQKYLDVGECFDSFKSFLRSVSVRRIGPAGRCPVSDSEAQRFEHVKEIRGIEFVRIGMRVEVDGRSGVIVGANNSANLDVIFDGQNHKGNVHPYWETVYFGDNGEVLRDYRIAKV